METVLAAAIALQALGGLVPPPLPTTAPATGVTRVDDDLVVVGRNPKADLIAGTIEWREGVVASYGPTTITADRLFVDRKNQRAQAVGNVVLTDPDGSLDARDIEFSWAPGAQTGVASDVRLQIGSARIRAARLRIAPAEWVLEDVNATTCRQANPLYEITARRLVVVPGKRGRAERPGLRILGNRLLSLPSYSFNLDRRAEGLRPPTISRRRDGQFGVNFVSGFPLTQDSTLSLNGTAFQGDAPSYGAIYTRSFVDVDNVTDIIRPRPDTLERFAYGYFESVEISDPADDFEWISRERSSLSAGTLINQGMNEERGGDLFLSKLLEVTYERGGPVAGGGAGLLTQTRLQYLRNQNPGYKTRIQSIASLAPRPLVIGRTSLTPRVEAAGYLGERSSGWLRVLAGAVYEPHPAVRLGLAGFVAATGGAPLFGSDELVSTRGFHARFDLLAGPTRVFALQKWDPKLGFYDREFSIYQTVGCLQVFAISRQYPQVYTIGVKLRFDDFVNLLQRRKFERSREIPAKPRTVVISDD